MTAKRIWIVIRPSGERFHVDKEPDGGIVEWAKGLDVTVEEYEFKGHVKKVAAKPTLRKTSVPTPTRP